ncbi:MAG: mannosyltransferase family protein [Sphingomonadales bacterium]|jgi:Gpi18-like mannosyltransferase|nr:mannosyltransferase family protein [Sphingomonadales bacterium]
MAVRFRPPPVVITLTIAFAIFGVLWPIVARDVRYDYIPWLDHIIATGPIAAFKSPFAAYNPPYLYLLALVSTLHTLLSALTMVKLVSLVATIALAFAVHNLLRQCEVRHAGRWAAIVMILPTTAANAAVLGQCDALYVAPAILALSAALGRRHAAMLIWCGISIAFKLQAILSAPFIIALLINRRVPIHYWVIPPLVFLASLLPAWIAGWPAHDLLGVYMRQSEAFSLVSLNAPNIWIIVQNLWPVLGHSLSGIALAIAVAASAIYIVWFSIKMPDGNDLYVPAILAVLVTAGLLPFMHERYFIFADVATFAFAAVTATRRAWLVAFLVQAGSALATIGYLQSTAAFVIPGAAAMIAATILLLCDPAIRTRNIGKTARGDTLGLSNNAHRGMGRP